MQDSSFANVKTASQNSCAFFMTEHRGGDSNMIPPAIAMKTLVISVAFVCTTAVGAVSDYPGPPCFTDDDCTRNDPGTNMRQCCYANTTDPGFCYNEIGGRCCISTPPGRTTPEIWRCGCDNAGCDLCPSTFCGTPD